MDSYEWDITRNAYEDAKMSIRISMKRALTRA